MKNFIRTFAAMSLVIGILLSLCSCGASSKVKLEDVVTVNVEGYNGHATAELDIDTDTINDRINAKKAAKFYSKVNNYTDTGNDVENAFYALDSYSASDNYFNTFLTIEPEEKAENLSNGDEITIVVKPSSSLEEEGYTLKDVEKGLGISIDDEMKYEVSGLETAKEVDVFKNVEKYVTYTGANGYSEATVEFTEDTVFSSEGYYFSYYSHNVLTVVKDNESLGSLTYNIVTGEDKENGKLTKGDKISVEINDNSSIFSLMETNGYIPSENSIDVTVPDLGTYVTKGSDITSSELEKIRSEVEAQIAGNYSEATMDGVLYASVKPQSVVDAEKKFMIVFVYTRPGFFGDSTEGIDVSGIKRTSDGKLSYSIGNDYSLYDGMDSLSDDWTYSRIA